jgi:hypothetical protein
VASLKSFIPNLARVLDMKPAAIYERQRALVRAGLLDQRSGHGPGSGVLATPRSFGLLLISIMATPNLSEVERQTRIVANLRSRTKGCPLTGKGTCASALTAVLESEELANRASFLMVERGGPESDATIAFDVATSGDEMGRPKSQLSRFGKDKACESQLYTQTYLTIQFDLAARFLRETEK